MSVLWLRLFDRHTDRERQTERERGCSNDIYSQNARSHSTKVVVTEG